jgi:type I restriction enzyme S subunit
MDTETFLNNFGHIADAPNGVQQLRELVLQLAIQGKLVRQINKEETVEATIKFIENERHELEKQNKYKKAKSLPPFDESSLPILLPRGWYWARMSQVVAFTKYAIKRGPFGSAIKKAYFVPKGYKVYEQKNAIYDDFSLGEYYINNEKFKELKAFEVKPYDIIISCSGTVGKVAIAPQGMEPGVINQALLKLSLNIKVSWIRIISA